MNPADAAKYCCQLIVSAGGTDHTFNEEHHAEHGSVVHDFSSTKDLIAVLVVERTGERVKYFGS